MFWKMSSIGWVIRLINRPLLNAPSQNEQVLSTTFYEQKNSTLDWVKRQIIYVWDWSVRSDPIISWDVNYTVLSLHVKRQIIEEGKRCATFYLCFHAELLSPSLSCPHLFFLFIIWWCIYCWLILQCHSQSCHIRQMCWEKWTKRPS